MSAATCLNRGPSISLCRKQHGHGGTEAVSHSGDTPLYAALRLDVTSSLPPQHNVWLFIPPQTNHSPAGLFALLQIHVSSVWSSCGVFQSNQVPFWCHQCPQGALLGVAEQLSRAWAELGKGKLFPNKVRPKIRSQVH